MIEGLFAMDEFVSDFDQEGDKRGYYIPIVADKRSKADKFDRIESLAGYFERKNVWFNSEQKNADMQVLIDQFLAFEKGSGAHDDGPDAVHGAFKWLIGRNRQSSNQYAFFAKRGEERNALVVSLCLSVAKWYIVDLCNADIIYDHAKERYDRAIEYLKRLAKGEVNISSLPIVPRTEETEKQTTPFLFGSRTKFNH